MVVYLFVICERKLSLKQQVELKNCQTKNQILSNMKVQHFADYLNMLYSLILKRFIGISLKICRKLCT